MKQLTPPHTTLLKQTCTVLIAGLCGLAAQAQVVGANIRVDQFGYRPDDRKVAVIANPIVGYNSGTPYSPGTSCELRRTADATVAFTAPITAWNGGATQTQSGDQVWWFDFTAFDQPGSYYVFDPTTNAASHPFTIDPCVYVDVLHQAARMFFYQRCGAPKAVPFAEAGWADGPCHIGALQDLDCRLYNDLSASTSKNLSGGWHDAGDYNKYVNFTFEPLTDLLHAYAEHPLVWTDDLNLPESGNGVPDLLDEVKHELDWLLKMQNNDGSVLSIVGVSNFASASPPSADAAQRVYGPATTAASFTASALFALAAVQFANAGQTAYANTLRVAAGNAWDWANAHPGVVFYNTGTVGAGEQEINADQVFARKFAAAVHLFAATGIPTYRNYVDANYQQMHLVQWGFAYPFESAEQEALLYYAALSNATPSVASAIRSAYTTSMQSTNSDNLPAYLNHTDAYRAHLSDQDHVWGSNTTKGHKGNMHGSMVRYALDPGNVQSYSEAALGFVNYFHGVNPTGFCFLSNMGAHGAENSINEFYHAWFTDGSALWDRAGVSTYGPAPGYVPGGVNPTYALDGCCPTNCAGLNALCTAADVSPPLGQPILKSYKDWNAGWPQNSWTITEAGIYTQAAYLRLLSRFVSPACSIATPVHPVQTSAFVYRVFPDPAIDQLTVQSDRTATFCLIDAMGRTVRCRPIISGNTTLDVSDLAKGLYVYRILAAEEVLATGCLVKQ